MNIFKYFLEFVILVFFRINESLADPPKISDTMIKMKAVKDRIFIGYDKTIRPTEEGSNTTEIYIVLEPRQIQEVSWVDPRLVWEPSEYDGDLPLSPDLLWIPDLTVFNSHSLQINPMQRVPILVWANGRIHWFPPIFTQTPCPALSEAVYPNGVVTCTVRFGSWAHSGWEIDFDHRELYFPDFLNIHPRWELITSDAKIIRKVTTYPGYEGLFMSLDAIFPLKRRMPPEIDATRNPCILVMILTLAIFWLPTNSTKKVLLGGFLFLVLTIFLVYVACSTRFPLGVVFAVSFLQSTMYILVITLLLQVLVIFNLCSITGPVRPPPAAMELLNGPFGKYACLKSSSENNTDIDRMQLNEDSPNTLESPTPKDDWMLFAAALDRLFFVLMSIAMIAIHHL